MISVVGTASGALATGSTAQSVNLPTVADGDTGLLVLTQNGGATLTPPSGWTQIGAQQSPFTTLRVWVYQRALTAALSGTAVSYSFSATQRSAKGIIVLRGARSVDVSAGAITSSTDSTALTVPGLTPTNNGDLLVALMGVRYATTTSGVTPPAGWTEQVDVSDGATTAPQFGVAILTKQLNYGSGVAQASATDGSVPGTGINGVLTVAVTPTASNFVGWGQPI